MPIELSALFDLPPADAVAAFEAKGYAISWNWHETWKEAHAKAFTVAKLARMDVLQDIREGVEQALKRGETQRWFDRDMTALLQRKGWWGRKIVVGSDGQAEVVQEGSPRRLQTIFRTNVQTAYAAGRWKRFSDNADARPYLQYVAVMDGRTRPAHGRLNGKVFPIDSPIWKVIGPPNGFNCRCAVRALSAADLERRGLRVEPDARVVERAVPVGGLVDQRSGEINPEKLIQRGVSVPDPAYPGKRMTLWSDVGWDYNPGAAGAAQIGGLVETKLTKLPQKLAAAVRKEPIKAAPAVAEAGPRYWDSTTDAGRWHEASFANAPTWLKQKIAAIGDPKAVLQTPGKGAKCAYQQYIEMGSRSRNTQRSQATWRHEYGHHLDGNIDGQRMYASANDRFSAALAADSANLVRNSGQGREGLATGIRRAMMEQAYREAAGAVANREDWHAWLAERFQKQGVDYASAVQALRKHTVFANALEGDALAQRMARISTAFDIGDAQGLMDALLGKGDFREVSACGAMGVCSSLSDLIGSVTRNQVAGRQLSSWGHSSAYYAKHPSLPGVEAWANLTCLHGEGGLFWQQVVEHFLPETNRAFLGAMGYE
ncbi:MAG: minor capsid protein [Candidatus Accumulibacter sp.]|uniref:phage head morphogenesis protein n=1 Tax=Accumulibacter sp. TaxID=2053492 RepID=UPI001B092234|nr:phage minor head protein [Accumulibacter sp.]MBO3701095.1 minor capsid protein [Accumulibacter sp.]